jgi:hypothetical protein
VSAWVTPKGLEVTGEITVRSKCYTRKHSERSGFSKTVFLTQDSCLGLLPTVSSLSLTARQGSWQPSYLCTSREGNSLLPCHFHHLQAKLPSNSSFCTLVYFPTGRDKKYSLLFYDSTIPQLSINPEKLNQYTRKMPAPPCLCTLLSNSC